MTKSQGAGEQLFAPQFCSGLRPLVLSQRWVPVLQWSISGSLVSLSGPRARPSVSLHCPLVASLATRCGHTAVDLSCVASCAERMVRWSGGGACGWPAAARGRAGWPPGLWALCSCCTAAGHAAGEHTWKHICHTVERVRMSRSMV